MRGLKPVYNFRTSPLVCIVALLSRLNSIRSYFISHQAALSFPPPFLPSFVSLFLFRSYTGYFFFICVRVFFFVSLSSIHPYPFSFSLRFLCLILSLVFVRSFSLFLLHAFFSLFLPFSPLCNAIRNFLFVLKDSFLRSLFKIFDYRFAYKLSFIFFPSFFISFLFSFKPFDDQSSNTESS